MRSVSSFPANSGISDHFPPLTLSTCTFVLGNLMSSGDAQWDGSLGSVLQISVTLAIISTPFPVQNATHTSCMQYPVYNSQHLCITGTKRRRGLTVQTSIFQPVGMNSYFAVAVCVIRDSACALVRIIVDAHAFVLDSIRCVHLARLKVHDLSVKESAERNVDLARHENVWKWFLGLWRLTGFHILSFVECVGSLGVVRYLLPSWISLLYQASESDWRSEQS